MWSKAKDNFKSLHEILRGAYDLTINSAENGIGKPVEALHIVGKSINSFLLSSSYGLISWTDVAI